MIAESNGDIASPSQTDDTGRKRSELEEFQTKVLRVLSTPSYAENARRYSEILRSHGGAKEAARLIEDVVTANAG